MSREFVELLRRRAEARRAVIANLDRYLAEIKRIATAADPSAEVYLFGSYARGDMRPDSDIDNIDCVGPLWRRAGQSGPAG